MIISSYSLPMLTARLNAEFIARNSQPGGQAINDCTTGAMTGQLITVTAADARLIAAALTAKGAAVPSALMPSADVPADTGIVVDPATCEVIADALGTR